MGRASHLSFDCSDSPICPLRGWPMTNALIGTCDRYLWSTSGSILDRHPDRYSVDTLRQSINNWQSVDRLTWIDWKLVDFQPTCWSRCWWGVNQVSSEVSMECWSIVNLGLIEGINPHSTTAALSTQMSHLSKIISSLYCALSKVCLCFFLLFHVRHHKM